MGLPRKEEISHPPPEARPARTHLRGPARTLDRAGLPSSPEVLLSARARAEMERAGGLRYWLDQVFQGDADAERAWLATRIPALEGSTPAETIEQGRQDAVVALLVNHQAGAF